MQQNVSVAYQGSPGSYSQEAAQLLCRQNSVESPRLIPQISSAGVVSSLLRGECDYGVVALENSTAGIVTETAEALQDFQFVRVDTVVIPIRHCLFTRDGGLAPESIKTIYSHTQALAQCRETIKRSFPQAATLPMDDTALAAQSLAAGAYGQNSAVICSKAAGTLHDLHLLRENMQDCSDNQTTFMLVKPQRPVMERREMLSDVIFHHLGSERAGRYATRAAVFASILVAIQLHDRFNMSSTASAWAVAGITTALIIFFFSETLQNWLRLRLIKGHWSYTIKPRFNQAPTGQRHELERVISISSVDSEITIKGWWQGDMDSIRWISTGILISQPNKLKGYLTYWYKNVSNGGADEFDGITTVSWIRSHSGGPVSEMVGWYLGARSGDVGTIVFRRISAEEANKVRLKARDDKPQFGKPE